MIARSLQLAAMIVMMLAFYTSATDVVSLGTGKWTDPTTWSNNAVPTANDNVTIMDGHTITLDADSATVKNLIIGPGTTGGLQTDKGKVVKLAVFGDVTLNDGMFFKTQTCTTGVALVHALYIQGNLKASGVSYDMRNGGTSGGITLGVMNVTFFGSANSTITMLGTYSTTNNEFNGITINKTGGAKLVMGSDIICAQGSSSAATADPYVNLVSGIIETGNFTFIHLSTTTATVSAGSATSYISGNMARAMSSSGAKLNTYPIGDAHGYRPVQVKSSTPGVATGHYLKVSCVGGNANNGSSAFPDNLIDKVSAVRYYKITYGRTVPAAPDTMGVDHFRPSYAEGDGIVSGNQDLRVAYSVDNRATWTTLGDKYPDTTVVSATPKYYSSDTLTTSLIVRENSNAVYFAIARLKGTTTNTLDPGSSITRNEVKSIQYQLEQNYPNPFNPSTKISYNLTNAGNVQLRIYDVLGREVQTLVNGYQSAGYYTLSFNAASFNSGIYFYTLKTGNYSETKKMILTK